MSDSPVNEASALHTTKRVGKFTAKSLSLRGLFKILGTVKKLGVVIPLDALEPLDFIDRDALLKDLAGLPTEEANATFDARAQAAVIGLSDEARAKIAASVKARVDAILHWLFGLEDLIPVLLSAVSDATEDSAADLTPGEALRLLTEAIDLIDIPGTVEAGVGFFTRIGGLMAEVGKQRAAAVAE